jgi:hypothetical protein
VSATPTEHTVTESPPSVRVVVGYASLYTVTAVVLFRLGTVVPEPVGYLLLSVLFAIPILVAYRQGLPPRWELLFLITTPLLPILVVIDPLETGLYGYDAYSFTIPALELLRSGVPVGVFVNADGDWPLFYAVALVVQQLTGSSLGLLAKYLPLFVVLIPLLVYAGVDRLTHRRTAFYTGMAVASTRTLTLFETKLVDETVAVLLFFTAITYLAVARAHRRATVGLAIVLAGLILSHHATSVFILPLVGGLLLARLLGGLPALPVLSSRLAPQRGDPFDVGIDGALLLGLGAGSVFVLLAPEVTAGLFDTAYGALFEGQQTATSVETEGPGGGIFVVRGVTPRQLISRAALVVFATMAGVTAGGVLSRYDIAHWELGWVGAAAVLAGLYLGSLVGGRVVPLSPLRILLFLVATITPPALSILSRSKLVERLTPARLATPDEERRARLGELIGIALVIGLILTQIAAIDPHVLYTDPASTVTGEGHHTRAQFAASEWTAQYFSGALIGAERSLWVANDNNYRNPVHGAGSCRLLLTVWRPAFEEPRPQNVSAVYDSGDVVLTRSASDPYIPGTSSNTQITPTTNAGPPACGTFQRSNVATA